MDLGHLRTAEDVAQERLKLMAFRERLPAGPVEPGCDVWRARVAACLMEGAIGFRAVALGLEDHVD